MIHGTQDPLITAVDEAEYWRQRAISAEQRLESLMAAVLRQIELNAETVKRLNELRENAA